MFTALLQGFQRAIPGICAVCHAWPASALCEPCIMDFGQPHHRCPTCALPLPAHLAQCRACKLQPPAWDRALAAVDYDYPWDRLIVDFKFRENPAWARHFAELMRAAPWIEPALEQADWVIPMPLSSARLKSRGFNQSQLLARQLSPAKTRTDLLLRIHDTPAQSTLPRHERLRNVANAFAVEPLHHHALAGKKLVIVDDVMTSGASLTAAARTLRAAGATHITAMVLARTPSD